MNSRQAKKAFKKKYGCNPKKVEKAAASIFDGIKGIVKALKDGVDAIRTMPEEEFFQKVYELLKTGKITAEQAAMTWAIRFRD